MLTPLPGEVQVSSLCETSKLQEAGEKEAELPGASSLNPDQDLLLTNGRSLLFSLLLHQLLKVSHMMR